MLSIRENELLYAEHTRN